MPTNRVQQAAGAVGGTIYVIGGRWESEVLNTIEEYTSPREMFVFEKE